MNNKFVTIKTFDKLIDVSFIKNLLELENIESNILDGQFISADPILSNALGGIKLQVLNKDVEKALAILEKYDNLKYCLKCNKVMMNHEKCDFCGYIPEVKSDKWGEKTMFLFILFAAIPFFGIFWGLLGIFQKGRMKQGAFILSLSLIVTSLFLFYSNKPKKETLYYSNGNKKEETIYKNGKAGKFTYWYNNGNKKLEANYKAGKKSGKLTVWYKNGEKKVEANYKNGEPDGKVTLFYENKSRKREAFYSDGVLNGKVIFYYKNGNKQNESFYSDGKQNGKSIFYYENGKKLKESFYKNGKLIKTTNWNKNGKKMKLLNEISSKKDSVTKKRYIYENGYILEVESEDNQIIYITVIKPK